MTSVEVRQARPEDAEAVLKSMRVTQAETDNLARDAHTELPNVAEEATWLANIQASPYDVFLVAFLDGELVGTANLAGSTRTRLAHRAGLGIAVERRAWGQGVGTALMHQLLAWARSTDLEIIDLEVRSDNLRAIRPYERFGFVRYARYEGFFKIDGKPISCDLMRLDL